MVLQQDELHITSPANNASFSAGSSIVLTASWSQPFEVAEVTYYSNGVVIGMATEAPFTFNWNDVPAGNYTITAAQTSFIVDWVTSPPVQVTVVGGMAPTISLNATPSNAVSPATIALEATAADTDGSVAMVEFFYGSNLLATVTQGPFVYSWENVGAGNYAVTARATDNAGNKTTSPAVPVTVTGGAPQIYYVYRDQINSANEITNSAGTVVWQANTSEPFGANLPNENPAGQGTFTYNPRFPGQYYDRETGLHYNYYRDYDPQTGRYIQSDPIGLEGGINTYAYVGGNPVSNTDPEGLQVAAVPTPMGPVFLPVPLPTPGRRSATGLVDPDSQQLPSSPRPTGSLRDSFYAVAGLMNPMLNPALLGTQIIGQMCSTASEQCKKQADENYHADMTECGAYNKSIGSKTYIACARRASARYADALRACEGK